MCLHALGSFAVFHNYPWLFIAHSYWRTFPPSTLTPRRSRLDMQPRCRGSSLLHMFFLEANRKKQIHLGPQLLTVLFSAGSFQSSKKLECSQPMYLFGRTPRRPFPENVTAYSSNDAMERLQTQLFFSPDGSLPRFTLV